MNRRARIIGLARKRAPRRVHVNLIGPGTRAAVRRFRRELERLPHQVWDPACVHYRTPRDGLEIRLANRLRGMSCPVCMPGDRGHA